MKPQTHQKGVVMTPSRLALITLCGLGASYLIIKLGRKAGFLLIAVIGLPVAILFLIVHSYQSFNATTKVATIQASPIVNEQHQMSIRYTTYNEDGKPSLSAYELAGDRVELNADIVAFNPILNILGVHNGYSVSRLTSQFDDDMAHSIQPVQLHANNPIPPLPWIEQSHYRNGIIFPDDNIVYHVYVTLTGDMYATHA
jgi:hypothetical protein